MTDSGGSGRARARKLTIPEVRARKGGERLAMVATYDVPFARLAETAGVDLLLVGDSLGMVVLGYESTVPVTMDDILHHCRAVVRGAPNTFVVADLPFLSYHLDDRQAIENAGRLLKEGGADAVKLEGGRGMASRIRAVVAAGIPVVGHVGLTPQSATMLGGFKIQGRDLDSAHALIDDGLAIADAGVFAMVVEAVPDEVAAIITARAPVPTIGIGAGPACDGQVLVGHDLLGFDEAPSPRFVRRYAELAPTIRGAFARFAADVRAGAFPGPD
ncbi:MAG TPA: 3-methyl-2-oxobutanoate hydroxymethyltransferase, partial [Thermomicrobiales bacterium]|nr:3-methyl-2-oxobutanoate hydroxymethyltransferase [Thermomicrobiales bacterium]